ncbi:MAG: hypothetical protein ACI8Z7_000563 [Candidatus Nanohaloarchaea archaeon]|jgi:hypothetical protein
MVYTSEAERVDGIEVEEVEEYLLDELEGEGYEGVENREGEDIDRDYIEQLFERVSSAVLIDDYDIGGVIGFSLAESQGDGGKIIDEILVDVNKIDEDQAYREMIE